MPLSWNEIRNRAIGFAADWAGESSEHAEAKTFWDEFFQVFGVPRRRIATFEKHVEKAGERAGFIDLFWPGVMIAEHKSRGKSLDKAYTQALDYFPGIRDVDLPRYVVVSDFSRFRIHDLETGEQSEFPLEALHQNVQAFGFIAGYQSRQFKEQDAVNIKAAEKLAALHDCLLDIGYDGHDLEVYLVRILFCLFAEDTGIFMPRDAFQDFIIQRTNEDGSDLGARLGELFEVLNTPESKRLRTRDEQLNGFPYVNGKLFEERLRVAAFDSDSRKMLLGCCDLDWGAISPAIFGSLFQGIMDSSVRRNLGAHYTSEKNILKVIGPLFMDELWVEFERVKNQKRRLKDFHEKLGSLKFFDPACGCGNFLVISYREIRLLEFEVIKRLYGVSQQQLSMDAISQYVRVDVDQFYGVEIEEWPSQIARVAMWLIDHQMNLMVGAHFGQALVRVPLVKSANIVNGNALRLDWNSVIPSVECDYLFGNPPFLGKKEQSKSQKEDFLSVMKEVPGKGVLDFVSAWYVKAAKYIGDQCFCAFVSTNSITQGEQVGALWGWLINDGVTIDFGHRTFKWTNEAKGVAAVHCVIIGFSKASKGEKRIFDYPSIDADPVAIQAGRVNPYLVDADDILLANRRTPISDAPSISYGSFALDDGFFTLDEDDVEDILNESPEADRFIRPFVGGKELIRGVDRWCLWLKDASPRDLRSIAAVQKRVKAVQNWRRTRDRATTRDLADTPSLFAEIRQPESSYLAFPTVSSVRRRYIPVALLEPDVIASNQVYVMPDASLYEFGIVMSEMHMAWVRSVCGRLKSDYRYSAGIVYNNFPWPADVPEKRRDMVCNASQGVLEARAKFPDATLADLYDPLSMPPVLARAHHALDKAVDAAYGRRRFNSEAERVSFLFELYEELVQ